MRTLVEIGLLNALSAGVLAVAALAARRWSRRPALVHALWLLVLLKLLTPPLLPVPVLAPEEEPAPAVVAPAPPRLVARTASAVRVQSSRKFTLSIDLARAAESGELVLIPETDTPAEFVEVEEAGAMEAEEPAATVAPPAAPKADKSLSLPAWLFDAVGLVWLAGCIVWFAVTGRRVVRFHRLLGYARPAPASLQGRADALARRLRLARTPSVWFLPGALPPLLWALGGRPRLFFPRALLEQLDDEGRDSLLLHELAHLRRRDHWVRVLEWLTLGLYWWNPLVWYGCRALHAAEEECCDAWVVSERPDAAPAYAGALLETVDFLAGARLALPPAASGFGRMYSLKRRLTMIMHGTTPRGLPPAGRLALLVLALVLLPLVPGRARPQVRQTETAAAASSTEPAEEEAPTVESTPRTILGGGGDVWSVAISPDGKILAVGAGGVGEQPGDLHLWDLAKGEELAAIREEKPIRRVAFSPDGLTLATGSFDTTIKLRDPKTGEVRRVLRGHTAAVNDVAFTSDSKTLVSAGLDNTVRVWDVATGAERRILKGHADWVVGLAVSRDGKFIASACKDGTAKVWDLHTGKELLTFKGHANWVECVAFAPDSRTIATGSFDSTIKLWQTETGRELRTLTGHNGQLDAVAFAPDGKTLASAGSDNTVRLWDTNSGESLGVLDGHTSIIYGLAFSPDGKTLASGSWDKTVKVWDVEAQKERATLQARIHRPENSAPILAMACSPDGKKLAVCGEDTTVRLLNAANGQILHVLKGHEDVIGKMAFSPDGKMLATAGFDRVIKLWDTASGKELATLTGHGNWVFCVAFSPDGKLLASGGYDKSVRLWDVAERKCIATLKGHRGSVRDLVFSRDGKTLASASSDRTVKLWDVSDPAKMREPRQTFKGHEGGVRCVAIAPDGRTLASGGEDNMVRVWEAATGKQIGQHQHNDLVLAVAFSPRGKMLASSSQDQTTRILDPSSGTQRALLRGHTDAVTSLAFAPDGRALYTGSADKTLKRWPASKPPIRPRVTLRDHGPQNWVALLTHDGKLLITAGSDGAVKVRPLNQARKEVSPQAPANQSSEITFTLKGHKGTINCAAVAPGDKLLATGGTDKTIRLWDLITGQELAVLTGHEDVVRCLAFSPDGKLLASASTDKTVRLWDVADRKEKAAIARFGVGAAGVAFSPDGKLLALCASDDSNANMPGGGIKLWDVAANREREAFDGAKVSALGVAFSPDGRLLASCAPAGPSVSIWDVASGKRVTMVRDSASVRHLAFSPDGKLLVTAHGGGNRRGNGSVQLWDTKNWQEVAYGQAHRQLAVSVAFSPDGRTLISASMDGTAMLWDVPTAQKDK